MRRTWLAPLIGALLVTGIGVSGSEPASAGASPSTIIRLSSQMTYLSGDEGGLFRLSLDIDRSGTASVELPSFVTVSAHRTVDTRDEVRAAAAGNPARIIDTVRIDVTERVDADGGPLDIIIASEVATRAPDLLQFPDVGLYPLTVSWEEDGDITSSFVTFIERLPAGQYAPSSDDELRVAVIGSITSRISLQPDSSTNIDDVDRQSIIDLVSIVETLPEMPITVMVQPELIDGLDRSNDEDATLLDRLRSSTSLRVLSNTFVDIDPSTTAIPGEADVFRRQLRLGEDVLTNLLSTQTGGRLVWLQNRQLTSNGGVLLAELGLRNIILSSRAQQTTTDGAAEFTDPTRKIELRTAEDTVLGAALVDTHLAETLSIGSFSTDGSPALAAQQVLAELRALRLELADKEESVVGRGVLLSTADGSLPSPDMLTALFRVLVDDRRLSLVDAEDLVTTMAVNVADGRPVTVELPLSTDLPDPNVAQLVADLTATVEAFSSMLPSGDFRPRQWRRLLDIVPHQAFTPDERNAYRTAITAETSNLSRSVSPPASTTFTLGGRRSPIRFSVRNDGDTDVRVRVRLTSAKLSIPDGEMVVSIPARSATAVDMPVVARSNGRFPVSLQMFTPNGDVPIGPVATLTARVNALAGLGQLVTGIALLLLLSWWASHLRRQRHRRHSQEARRLRHHPSENPTHQSGST